MQANTCFLLHLLLPHLLLQHLPLLLFHLLLLLLHLLAAIALKAVRLHRPRHVGKYKLLAVFMNMEDAANLAFNCDLSLGTDVMHADYDVAILENVPASLIPSMHRK